MREMNNKKKGLGLLCLLFLLLTGCDNKPHKIEKVGLLIPSTVNDQVWGTKGYTGLVGIQSEFGVDIFYKEKIDSESLIEEAVEEFHKRGVNLVFGHGDIYTPVFNKLGKKYPDMHFVGFNGDAKADNVTSLNFSAYAMGFFGGMVAGKMTETNQVGIIAAYAWQPEVKGFADGAAFQNKKVNVDIRYVHSWDDVQAASHILNNMLQKNVDVVYPAGDGYNVPLIEELKERNLYSIGFISDQSHFGGNTVLTSTVQDVAHLYVVAAEKFDKGELQSGNAYFDFQDGVVSMGEFSQNIDESFREKIQRDIETYQKTGKLPNEK